MNDWKMNICLDYQTSASQIGKESHADALHLKDSKITGL